MTTTTQPPAIASAPFTTRFVHLLQALARGRAPLILEARSLHGYGRGQESIRPHPEHLSAGLLNWLADETWELRAPVCTMTPDHAAIDFTVAACMWRPACRFDAATNSKREIDAAAQETIREALASFPLQPSFITDAGPEVVAWWPLTEPLPVDRNPGPAIALLEALTRRLGGDLNSARSLATAYPLAGCIRNWINPPERIDILEAAPGQTYTTEELTGALGSEAV